MKFVGNWHGYDDWLTRDLPDDEPTEEEERQRRDDEQDRRWVEEIFR